MGICMHLMDTKDHWASSLENERLISTMMAFPLV